MVLCKDGVQFGKEPVKLKYDCGGHEVFVSQNGSGVDVRKLFPSMWSEGIGVTGEDPCLEELGFECIFFGLRCEVSSV
ncbi:unnamed protein product [Lepidochelys olivacea]